MAELTLTDNNFEQEVLQSKIPVLVDFWAKWCMPCRMMSPVIEELAKEYDGKVKVGKIDVEESSKTAAQYGIMSIPSLLIFKNGKPVKNMVGVQGKEVLKKEIEEVLRV